jgi:quercetin dioxygenase-like cupin family protein
VPGEITVQCLEGSIDFETPGRKQRLQAGQLLFLHGGEPHALLGVDDASVLVTIVLN